MTILKLNDIPAGAPTVILTGDFSNVPGAITLQQKEKRIHLEHGTLGAVPLTFRTEGFEGIEVYSATETGTEYFLSFLPDGTTVPLSVTFVAGLRYQSDLREIIRNGSVPLSGPLVTSGQLADLVLDDQTTWSRIKNVSDGYNIFLAENGLDLRYIELANNSITIPGSGEVPNYTYTAPTGLKRSSEQFSPYAEVVIWWEINPANSQWELLPLWTGAASVQKQLTGNISFFNGSVNPVESEFGVSTADTIGAAVTKLSEAHLATQSLVAFHGYTNFNGTDIRLTDGRQSVTDNVVMPSDGSWLNVYMSRKVYAFGGRFYLYVSSGWSTNKGLTFNFENEDGSFGQFSDYDIFKAAGTDSTDSVQLTVEFFPTSIPQVYVNAYTRTRISNM